MTAPTGPGSFRPEPAGPGPNDPGPFGPGSTDTGASPTMSLRVLFSWLFVLAPVCYGVYMAIKSVQPLFGG
jgi:hypothetical protein